MTARRTRLAIGWLFVVLLAAGCSGRRAGILSPDALDASVASSGLYRVSIQDPAEGRRRFRLLLFAELPDRLYGEVLSPLGTVVAIVDGGAGRMAVTLVRDRVSFAGPAREDALERVLGVRMTLEGLVRGLLTGDVEAGQLDIIREAGESPALPSRLVLDDGRRSVTLELKRLQPLRAAPEELGRGVPPEGMEVRPLSELSMFDVDEALPVESGT